MRNNNTTAEIIFALLQELSKEQAEQFAMNLWSLWKSRNLRIWQNVSETCQAITIRASQLLQQWRVANEKKQMRQNTNIQKNNSLIMSPYFQTK